MIYHIKLFWFHQIFHSTNRSLYNSFIFIFFQIFLYIFLFWVYHLLFQFFNIKKSFILFDSFNKNNFWIFFLLHSVSHVVYFEERFSENTSNIFKLNHCKLSFLLILIENLGSIFFNQLFLPLVLFFAIQYFLYSSFIYNLTFSRNLLFIFLIILSSANLLCLPLKNEFFLIYQLFYLF